MSSSAAVGTWQVHYKILHPSPTSKSTESSSKGIISFLNIYMYSSIHVLYLLTVSKQTYLIPGPPITLIQLFDLEPFLFCENSNSSNASNLSSTGAYNNFPDIFPMEIDKQGWTFKADMHLHVHLLVVLSLSETKGQV